MVEVSHKTSAAVLLKADAKLDMAALPGIIGWLLAQSNVRVHSLDLGLTGATLE